MDTIIMLSILVVVFALVIMVYQICLTSSEKDREELEAENARLRTILHL